MQKNIIYDEDLKISYSEVLEKLHIDEDDEFCFKLKEMINETIKIARPAAIYFPCKVTPGDSDIKINNITLKEPFLIKMLSKADIVVPYVVTCGKEIDEWSEKFSDLFEQYAADIIKQLCLSSISDKLYKEVNDKYFNVSKNLSSLNPGSLKEWPLTGQIPLFKILGTVTDDIGVSLSESLLMTPNKSVSGIFFQSDEMYENCQYCPRNNCPNRRAENLYTESD